MRIPARLIIECCDAHWTEMMGEETHNVNVTNGHKTKIVGKLGKDFPTTSVYSLSRYRHLLYPNRLICPLESIYEIFECTNA